MDDLDMAKLAGCAVVHVVIISNFDPLVSLAMVAHHDDDNNNNNMYE
jgi:hypothetical protein